MNKTPVRSRKRTLGHLARIAPPNFALNDLRLFIDYVALDGLKPPRRALRKHGDRSLKAIEVSIRQNGFLVPILVDGNRRIVVGHARWLAAKNAGLDRVPIIEVSHLTEEQIRVFTICDNKLASVSEWDVDELRLEFAELAALNLDYGLNLELTGFSTAEIDGLLTSTTAQISDGDSVEHGLPNLTAIAVSRPGDVWQIGTHKQVCGSSVEEKTFADLMDGERAQMIFSDPPYNLKASMISGKGKHRHGDFAMGSGEMVSPEFIGFLLKVFRLAAQFSTDGSIHFQCMDWRHMREMLEAGYQAYSELKNLIVWKKHSGGMGSFYRSQHELIFVWKNGTGPHINNFGLGETGRYRTNVWEYHGNSGFHKERDVELASHATVKPWSMVADAIRDCSKRGGIILDPFGGSGTTLIAAERTGRKARLIELDPLYCDVTIRRWQKLTGKQAVLLGSGQTFHELEEQALARADNGVPELADSDPLSDDEEAA